MEHSSHGCSGSIVVGIERRRILRAATWSAFPGGSKKRFDDLVSEDKEGGYRLEASRARRIATGLADALHDLLAAELLQIVGRAGGTILRRGLLAKRTDARRQFGSAEAVRNGRERNNRFGNPAHARLVQIDPADYNLADARCRWQTLKRLIGDEAGVDAAQGIGKSLQNSLQPADDLWELSSVRPQCSSRTLWATTSMRRTRSPLL